MEYGLGQSGGLFGKNRLAVQRDRITDRNRLLVLGQNYHGASLYLAPLSDEPFFDRCGNRVVCCESSPDMRPDLESFLFDGQSIIKVTGNRATATTYCRAYHLKLPDGLQHLMIAGIRYYDTMVKQNGAWLFAERKLKVCWIENR